MGVEKEGLSLILNPFFIGENMDIHFYRVDIGYCEYLKTIDNKIPNIKNDKSNRPFVGIVLEINNIKYYAPLTSPKPKHSHMKNQEDFLKIDSGKLGCINFNNMIPIHDNYLLPIEVKIYPNDTKEIIDYKNLVVDQLSWCNINREKIIKKANKLYYSIINNKARNDVRDRCCDFKKLERGLIAYCKQNNISL